MPTLILKKDALWEFIPFFAAICKLELQQLFGFPFINLSTKMYMPCFESHIGGILNSSCYENMDWPLKFVQCMLDCNNACWIVTMHVEWWSKTCISCLRSKIFLESWNLFILWHILAVQQIWAVLAGFPWMAL